MSLLSDVYKVCKYILYNRTHLNRTRVPNTRYVIVMNKIKVSDSSEKRVIDKITKTTYEITFNIRH